MKQLTLDVIINTLTKIYKEKHYHDDFQKINQDKINILNKYLFEGKNFISFDGEHFSFSTNKQIDVSYINYFLNDLLNKYSFTMSLARDELTTTKEIVEFKKHINLHISNRVISSHFQQIQTEYFELIKQSLMYLYFVPFRERSEAKNLEIIFHLNETLSDEDFKIFNNSLDEIDYL